MHYFVRLSAWILTGWLLYLCITVKFCFSKVEVSRKICLRCLYFLKHYLCKVLKNIQKKLISKFLQPSLFKLGYTDCRKKDMNVLPFLIKKKIKRNVSSLYKTKTNSWSKVVSILCWPFSQKKTIPIHVSFFYKVFQFYIPFFSVESEFFFYYLTGLQLHHYMSFTI